MTAPALAGALTRWLLFAGILVQVGAAAFRFLVLPRVRGIGAEALHRRAAERAAGLAVAAACLTIVAALARLPLQLLDIRDPLAPLAPQARALILQTMWGKAWFAQLGAAVLSLAGFAFARGGRRSGAWVLAAGASAALAFTPAFAGHAIGSERLAGLAVAADGVHVLAAGAWLGAMVVLYAGITLPREIDQAGLAGALIASFSPLALASAAALGLTGAIASWLHLGVVAALWQSRYGRRLLVKLGAVGLVALLGAFNWRRAGPKLMYDNDVEPMQRSIRAELMVGVLVLFATAVLVATPPPGEE